MKIFFKIFLILIFTISMVGCGEPKIPDSFADNVFLDQFAKNISKLELERVENEKQSYEEIKILSKTEFSIKKLTDWYKKEFKEYIIPKNKEEIQIYENTIKKLEQANIHFETKKQLEELLEIIKESQKKEKTMYEKQIFCGEREIHPTKWTIPECKYLDQEWNKFETIGNTFQEEKIKRIKQLKGFKPY